MKFQAVKATRELIWTKVALMAPSGGGKTYSGLKMATGMLEKLKELGLEQNGRILMANTESSRGRYYADEFDFDIVDVPPPHEPEKYVELINWAVEQDYPILLLDSSSHEWEGSGGCLELHQKAGGSYQAWARVTPRHDAFITKIADSPIHIIATMRGKDAYEIEKGENDKIKVKKLGIGAKQREGFEYEFTCTFLIDQKTNMAEPQKDNTHLFEDKIGIKINEDHGKKLIEWANSGEGYTVPVRSRKSEAEIIGELKDKVVGYCRELGGSDNDELMTILKQYEPTIGNPKKIKNLNKLEELSIELENMINAKEEKENKNA